MSNFAQTIYETPETWGGENYLMDFATLAETVGNLRTLPTFETVDVSDCATLTLAAEQGRVAVYEYDHTAPGKERFILVRLAAFGHYAHSGRTYKTLLDALADIEN